MKTIDIPKTTLNNGVEMPIVGYGTYLLSGDDCVAAVKNALAAGYRHIDTAQMYGNERQVGQAIAESGVPRGDIFITTKLNIKKYETEDARAALEQSFSDLGVDYIDLVLLHWPFGNYYAGYRVLEEFYEAGKVKAIGVSNFEPDRLVDLIAHNSVKPAVNQIETNLLAQQVEAAKWLKKYDVQHESYAPLGQGRPEALAAPELKQIADVHRKTVAQIAIKYQIQRGIVTIPKGTSPEHIRQNIDIFDFELSIDEMKQLRALDQNQPAVGTSETPEKVEFALTW